MTPAARRLKILDLLREAGFINISQVAEELGVSTMTVRRDLAHFAEHGLVTITRGGAILNEGTTLELTYDEKRNQMVEEKKRIGAAAAAMVKDGDSVFIDCGTTPAQVAAALVGRKNLVVVTNSLLATNVLSQSTELTLVMVPGTFRDKSMGFIGSTTVDYVRQFRVDWLFLGADGMHPELGATVPDLTDGQTKRALVECARKVVVVADHTKNGKAYFFVAAPIDKIDYLITGSATPAEMVRELERKISVVLV